MYKHCLLVAALAITGCAKKISSGGGGETGATYTPPADLTPNAKCQKAPTGTGILSSTSTGATVGNTTAPSPTSPNGAATGPATATLALDASPASAAPGGSWSAVKTVLQTSCIGACHQHDNLLTVANAKAVAAQMVEDTDLEPSDPNFMPQGGTRLTLADREKLVLWLNAGTPDDASDQAPASAGTATGVGTVDGKSRFTLPAEAGPPADGC